MNAAQKLQQRQRALEFLTKVRVIGELRPITVAENAAWSKARRMVLAFDRGSELFIPEFLR